MSSDSWSVVVGVVDRLQREERMRCCAECGRPAWYAVLFWFPKQGSRKAYCGGRSWACFRHAASMRRRVAVWFGAVREGQLL